MNSISLKKNLLTSVGLAVVAMSASTTAMAQAKAAPAFDFTWYGRIDLGFESNSNGAVSRTAVQNFSSRLGIRGERKFDAEISGIFQVETGVAPDDTAQSKTFASRNSFVGIKSASAGSLIVGTHDMPLKSMQGTAYSLWGEGDLQELIIHGKASRTAIGNAVFDNAHTRRTNVVLYTSPKFSNVVVKFAYSPDEAAVGSTPTVGAYDRPMWGASITYYDGTFNAGFATQNQDNFIVPTATASGKDMSANKFTFGAKMGALSGGMAFSKLDNSAGKKTDNWLLSGAYVMDKVTLKASFGRSSESSSGAADDVSATALEVDYAFDKSFTLYGYYTQISNGTKAKGSFAAADNFPAVVTAGDDPRALGVGIRYNF